MTQDNWFKDHPTFTIVTHTIAVVIITLGAAKFLFDDKKLLDCISEKNLYIAKSETLEKENNQLATSYKDQERWLLADTKSFPYLSKQIKNLQEENDKLRKKIEELKPEIRNFSSKEYLELLNQTNTTTAKNAKPDTNKPSDTSDSVSATATKFKRNLVGEYFFTLSKGESYFDKNSQMVISLINIERHNSDNSLWANIDVRYPGDETRSYSSVKSGYVWRIGIGSNNKLYDYEVFISNIDWLSNKVTFKGLKFEINNNKK